MKEQKVLRPFYELPPGGLRLYPFTLFIGRQGTGKSQMSESLFLSANLGAYTMPGNALYVPAIRVVYFHSDPATWRILFKSASLIYFAFAMEMAGETLEKWPNGEPDTEEGKWIHRVGKKAFAGAACREGNRWKWNFEEGWRLDIDSASSGQKAGWPIVLLAETLFSWRRDRKIPPNFILHIEEPEIHLHPETQVAIVKILAYLVNRGFQVLATTHSLTILHTLNNLLAASVLPEDIMEPGIPEPEVRLKQGMAGAYFFQEDRKVVSLVDEETGLLSETEMAAVGEQLIAELNQIEHLRTYRSS